MPPPPRFLGSFPGVLPDPTLPEVAFAGRSNVGKSSTLNVLLGVHGLARISRTPGRTRALNLFEVEGRWIAVDLPGYGHAKVSHKERASWGQWIEAYLTDRPTLRLVLSIVDARIPVQDSDRQLLRSVVARGVPVLVLANKIDALTRQKRLPTALALAQGLGIGPDQILPFSATEGIGKDEALTMIRQAVRER